VQPLDDLPPLEVLVVDVVGLIVQDHQFAPAQHHV
jgi:hypothetical protein